MPGFDVEAFGVPHTNGIPTAELLARHGRLSFKNHGINSLTFTMQSIGALPSRRQLADMEPGVLVDAHTLFAVRRHHTLEVVSLGGQVHADLVVGGGEVAFAWEDPNLQEANVRARAVVLLAVHDPGAGAHDLDVALLDHRFVPHAVLVFEVSGQRDADDFHVVVGVRPKSGPARHGVVIQDTQRSEVHAFGMVPTRKTEAVVGVEPAVVGVAS